MKKLNLQWVSDSIGDDYKKWNKGDTVLIQAQTGTGKTYFIKEVLLDELDSNDRLLFISNRTNLKRQIKKDLLKKHNLTIPETLEELDGITKIEKVSITSYHAISDNNKDSMYGSGEKWNLGNYDYIVMDEVHFLFSDSGFNNKTRFAYDELVREHFPYSIKIFISATMHEIRSPIIKRVEQLKSSGFGLDNYNIHEYNTGNDYSYITAKYFNKINNIINLIKNDMSDEKWLIFISDIGRDGNRILEELGDEKCSLIKSGTNSDELTSIINDSKFNKKVLISTKAMDNGVNIDDPLLKNIVIMTWDRISFIQMLGRKRIDIDNAETVNLYIPTRYKNSFRSKLNDYYKKKKAVKLLNNDKMEFYRKFDNALKDFNGMNDIFYREFSTGEIKFNEIGCARLLGDIKFAEYMVAKFDYIGKYAFIHEQLSWLGLKDSNYDENMITEVVVNEEVDSLNKYLNSVVGEKLFNDDQQKLSDLIINELITVSPKTDYRTKKLKPSTLEIIIREQLELPYAVSKPKKETKGDMKDKRYIVISKLN
ncbi:DEAD/DEAH box helicase family protein [Bacillaceae bacterium C204]|uniref:DEAD/DEAH box helicase family protein n=1 Tax=Neobacillus sp. 204 TaxID=3383351 RepID=UPI00397CF021